jgi:predicted transcriptional regulator
METPARNHEMLIELTADVVAAYVSNNPVPASDLPALIGSIHLALGKLTGLQEPEEKLKPAVPIAKSVKRDYIFCLEDGLKFKSLKRHLASKYDMTPQEYREKWGLPRDYPMVAPSYSEARRAVATRLGLGRKPVSAAAPAEAAKPSTAATEKKAPAKKAPAAKAAKAPAKAPKAAAAPKSAKKTPAAKAPAKPRAKKAAAAAGAVEKTA